MNKKPIRVYADTSVFGGVFDEEFQHASEAFFSLVRAGVFTLVTSELVQDELIEAPDAVRALFTDMLTLAEVASITAETIDLQRAYLSAGVVSENYPEDAMHVALATVLKCEMIVSWNFKHIVHFQKVPRYNAVNTLCGYAHIGIFSPQEVAADED